MKQDKSDQGIVLDEKAQEQPKDKATAQSAGKPSDEAKSRNKEDELEGRAMERTLRDANAED